jgi:hypothetical protein
MVVLALGESARVVPYVVGSRKAVRAYLKVRFLFFLFGGEEGGFGFCCCFFLSSFSLSSRLFVVRLLLFLFPPREVDHVHTR